MPPQQVTGVRAIACSVSVDLCLFLFTFVHIKYTVFVFQNWLRPVSASSIWGPFSWVYLDQGCLKPSTARRGTVWGREGGIPCQFFVVTALLLSGKYQSPKPIGITSCSSWSMLPGRCWFWTICCVCLGSEHPPNMLAQIWRCLTEWDTKHVHLRELKG